MKKNKWYHHGLNFKCTECGKCCTGSPGYVWVNEKEIEEMAATLNLSSNEFKKRYIRRVGNRYSLTESRKNYDCVFLKEKKCMVYKARPTQCRTYPWWPQNLKSQEAWEETSKTCEGIHPEAHLVPTSDIEEQELIQITRNARSS